MKVILSGVRSGKTTKAIKIAAKNDLYIVCHSLGECSRIAQQAKDAGLNIRFPVTFEELIRKQYYAKGIKGIVIDNVDMLLQKLVPDLKIEAITINKEERKLFK